MSNVLLKEIARLEVENRKLKQKSTRVSILEDEDIRDLATLNLVGTAIKLFRPAN